MAKSFSCRLACPTPRRSGLQKGPTRSCALPRMTRASTHACGLWTAPSRAKIRLNGPMPTLRLGDRYHAEIGASGSYDQSSAGYVAETGAQDAAKLRARFPRTARHCETISQLSSVLPEANTLISGWFTFRVVHAPTSRTAPRCTRALRIETAFADKGLSKTKSPGATI